MGLNLKRRLHAPGDSVKIFLWQLDIGIDLSIGATTGTNRVKSHNHPGVGTALAARYWFLWVRLQ